MNNTGRCSVHLSISLRSLTLFWDLDGFLSHNIWINVKMARRRNAACSDNNLFGFKLGTLKYIMGTVTDIAPDAAWTTPELEVSVLNKLTLYLSVLKSHCFWSSAAI